MKRFLMLVLWITVGISALALTAAGSATAKSAQGAGTHRAAIHVINLHKAYEARLGRTTQGKIAGTVYPVGTPATHSRGGNNCVEPDCAVYYQGGQVQHNPHVYLLLWGPNWSNDPNQAATAAYLASFYHGLGTQPQDDWSTTTEQYKDGTGAPTFGNSVYVGAFHDMNTPTPPIGQTQLAAEADAFAATQGITDLADAQIIVATQSGTCPDGFYAPTCNGGSGYYCAWHSYSNEPYTNLPYVLDAGGKCGENFVNSGSGGTDDGFSMVGGHEYAETITDPNPNTGWFDPLDLGGGEIGDKCVWSPQSGDVSLQTGSFAMQPLWSNSAYASNPGNGCVMSSDVKGDVTMDNPGTQTNYQDTKLTLQAVGTSSDGYQLTWSASGLPSGLTIGSSSGLISGQVDAAPGTYNVTVSASDPTVSSPSTMNFSWIVTADIGSLVTNKGSGLCLNDYQWAITPGNLIMVWRCTTTGKTGNEKFRHPTSISELTVFGQCVTAQRGAVVGQLVHIDPCTGSAAQEWLHSKGEFILQENKKNLCLTDPYNATINGIPVVLEKCTSASDQQWIGN